MPTKYILHGGFSKKDGPVLRNDEFFRAMLSVEQANIKLLLVYFAERDDMVDLRIEQDTGEFDKNKGAKQLEIRIAAPETFIADCQWADVIYLHGGRTVKLMAALKKFQGLEQAWAGKVVAGDSAGANVLGRLFYSKGSDEIGEGLGILPYKILVHYTDGAPDPLADKLPGVETLILHEYEIKVINK